MKTGRNIPHFASGPREQRVAMTAPAAPKPHSIAGFGAMKTAGGCVGPSAKPGPSGFNAPSCKHSGPKMSGGPSRAGPAMTQGGASTPTAARGPTGIGLSGNQYPKSG